MHLFIVKILFICTFIHGISSNQHFEPKIVGGREANLGQFPYQISLRYAPTNQHFCGGSIIDDRHVLTAAHCMEKLTHQPKSIVIWVGGLNVYVSDNNWKSFRAKHIFIHEQYNKTSFQENDIAIIRIKERFPQNNKLVQPINILNPNNSANIVAGTNCTVSGWGTVSSGGRPSKTLLYTNVDIMDRKSCSGYNPIFTKDMICAGLKNGGHDACQGDSGGPLVCNGIQTGIVSFGRGCAEPNYPGVYTNVSAFNSWIEDVKQRSKATIFTSASYTILISIFLILSNKI